MHILPFCTILMPLENIDKADFSKLSEARAAWIDKDFDAMNATDKPVANKELAELAIAKKLSEEALKADLQ
jgi:hypothetical protein